MLALNKPHGKVDSRAQGLSLKRLCFVSPKPLMAVGHGIEPLMINAEYKRVCVEGDGLSGILDPIHINSTLN